MFANVLSEVRGASTQCFLSSVRLVNVILLAVQGSWAKHISLVFALTRSPARGTSSSQQIHLRLGENDLHYYQAPPRYMDVRDCLGMDLRFCWHHTPPKQDPTRRC